ncbi:radical SAM protein [Actinomadura logoneensis]|uniref:Radical SAM protein n=1 Tax=Actinomadura logoneensis TaxID=2293572 RepID=A0A372JUF4_9ACTN|nr:radical SAM protein [Actinomadura logoneensis]
MPVTTYVHTDRTLRAKIIDGCGMTCTFCHNEGTPVVADNLRTANGYAAQGASGRVSIYLGTNGARFLPATVVPDAYFASTLTLLRDALDLNELHLTGGEPTLHPQLAQIVQIGVQGGLRVCVTSNGERGAAVWESCARAGLDRVNFSIFGTTPDELAQVQHSRFANIRRAERKIAALKDSVTAAERAGIPASANIVVPNYAHAPRVLRLLEEYSPWLDVRLLNSLADGAESIEAITRILADLGAVATAHHLTAGVSGSRTAYELPDGRTIWFKQIRSVRLPETCSGCRFNNDSDCQEGFYGVRLYRDARGGYQVGVCIQRMDLCMPVADFVRHDLCREVLALRDAEYRRLSKDRF